MTTMQSRLESLAGADPARNAVLAARLQRCRVRRKNMPCRACGESAWDDRDPTDICDPCLCDLWGARDVLAGEFKVGKKGGLVAVHIPDRWHWLPYPHLATNCDVVDDDAPFARDERGSARTLQRLYWELFASLAKALPCDPESRTDATDAFTGLEQVCDGGWDSRITFRLPKDALKSLIDIWRFVRWHSHAAYFEGFEAGRALITGLATGTHTAEQMAIEVEEQTRSLQAEMAKTKTVRRKEKRA